MDPDQTDPILERLIWSVLSKRLLREKEEDFLVIDALSVSWVVVLSTSNYMTSCKVHISYVDLAD